MKCADGRPKALAASQSHCKYGSICHNNNVVNCLMFTNILAPIQEISTDRPVFDSALAFAKQNQAGLIQLTACEISPEGDW